MGANEVTVIHDGCLHFRLVCGGEMKDISVDLLLANMTISEVAGRHSQAAESGVLTSDFFIDLHSTWVEKGVIPGWVSVYAVGEIFTEVTEQSDELKKKRLWRAMSPPSTESTPPSSDETNCSDTGSTCHG